jgi:hypothetical protein
VILQYCFIIFRVKKRKFYIGVLSIINKKEGISLIIKYNVETLEMIIPLLKDFQYHLCSYREICSVFNDLPGDPEFWIYTCDAHLKMASISWCMVFGAESNSTHWKKLALDNNTIDISLKEYVMAKTGVNEKDYDDYWGKMVSFRNYFVAHKKDFNNSVPYFEFGEKIVEYFDQWIRNLIYPDVLDYPTLDHIWDEYLREIRMTLSQVIVNCKLKG